MVHCNFCGLDFDLDCAEVSCGSCPLVRNCQRITCPRCGYSIMQEAALVRWLRKLGSLWQEYFKPSKDTSP